MLLYLVKTIEDLRVTDRQFFRLAHIWCFGTDPDLGNDVMEFKLHSIIPKYVERYLNHLKETSCK
jgi:hypothetical protein